jgi:hypothetical protein
MAARVTASEVKQIMDGCTTADAVITIMIGAATELIDEVFLNDTDVSTTLLKEIERWLTAHMIASTVYRTTSDEKIGDAQVKYTGKWGSKLESTPYGQMVLTLDFTGKMAKMGKMGASITAIESFN